MCRYEVFGDWYRGCSHFVMSYYSGVVEDCEHPLCKGSKAHTHKAPNCPCEKYEQDDRRIVNMFHQACEDCRSAEFARRVGR
ncbi:hypothetical protein D9611_001556 [Ephemerocybe angulata]|uniref:Uncharacterized protein n=2 Tax=Ephemerocybe angulata TaxID=980116 RepID=A0A8H6I1M8_9AGAR|nr:hypothetical protein D9611_001556 [Tulosesus angulatus]KAF6757258.1 hypothetical protein DFP72DRAFT_892142 [Tulosesus angulatus]